MTMIQQDIAEAIFNKVEKGEIDVVLVTKEDILKGTKLTQSKQNQLEELLKE